MFTDFLLGATVLDKLTVLNIYLVFIIKLSFPFQ